MSRQGDKYFYIQGFLGPGKISHEHLAQELVISVVNAVTKENLQRVRIEREEYADLVPDEEEKPDLADLSFKTSIEKQNSEPFEDQVYEDLIQNYFKYDEVGSKFIFLPSDLINSSKEKLIIPDGSKVARVSSLQTPNANRGIPINLGTSRGSFLTSSINGNSLPKLPSDLYHPTTFGRSSDTKSVPGQEENA